MNEIQFYTAIAALARSWFLTVGTDEEVGHIRTRYGPRNDRFCPITALCFARTGEEFELYEFQDAAGLLGLSFGLAEDLMNAADDDEEADQAMRGALLAAVGLEGGAA